MSSMRPLSGTGRSCPHLPSGRLHDGVQRTVGRRLAHHRRRRRISHCARWACRICRHLDRLVRLLARCAAPPAPRPTTCPSAPETSATKPLRAYLASRPVGRHPSRLPQDRPVLRRNTLLRRNTRPEPPIPSRRLTFQNLGCMPGLVACHADLSRVVTSRRNSRGRPGPERSTSPTDGREPSASTGGPSMNLGPS